MRRNVLNVHSHGLVAERSFSLPSVKVKPSAETPALEDGPFGVPAPLTYGLAATRNKLGFAHPLEASERDYQLNRDKMNLMMLRNHSGLHAPLKLTMELKAANKVGRLPFLPSSNVMRDVLTGRDLDIGFEDFLQSPEFCEVSGQPHAVVERSLGLL